jgi:hypothetical protein
VLHRIRLEWLAAKVKSDPHRLEYTDKTLVPMIKEGKHLELYQTRSSRAFLDQQRRIAEAQKSKPVAP